MNKWDCVRIDIIEGSVCDVCCKTPINQVCFMKNRVTGAELQVGNCCVRKFFGMDFSSDFEQIKISKQKAKNREAHASEIAELEKMRSLTGNPWERDFLTTMVNNIESSTPNSQKQQEIFDRLKKNLLREMTAVEKATLEVIVSIKKQGDDFERSFMDSIKDCIVSGRTLSYKQEQVAIKVFKKYGFDFLDIFRPVTASFKIEDFILLEPRAWQLKAFNKWYGRGRRGTVQAATGVGKTILGLMAISKVVGSMLIVVPTIVLQKQWKDELISKLKISPECIGFIGGGEDDDSKLITIAVVNSIRDRKFKKKLLVMDEVHRYGGSKNIKFLDNGDFDMIIGLTATFKREDGRDALLAKHAPVIYEYSQADGIEDGHLCRYKVVNKEVEFNPEEREVYERLHETVKALFPLFRNDIQQVISCQRMETARECRKALQERRTLLFSCQSKVDACLQILLAEKNGEYPKTFIFGEYIETCNKVYELLKREGIPAGIYHSRLKPSKKKQMIQDFKDDKLRVIVSVKALEEGVDVPAADVAIIIGGTHVKRQSIQRLGRILRNRPGKMAKVFQLFAADTVDKKWVSERAKVFRGVADSIDWE